MHINTWSLHGILKVSVKAHPADECESCREYFTKILCWNAVTVMEMPLNNQRVIFLAFLYYHTTNQIHFQGEKPCEIYANFFFNVVFRVLHALTKTWFHTPEEFWTLSNICKEISYLTQNVCYVRSLHIFQFYRRTIIESDCSILKPAWGLYVCCDTQ